jgi:starch phosphorylase
MPEALERWSIPMFQELLPRIFLIVDEINRRWMEAVRQRFPGKEDKAQEVAILWNNQVHMASLAVVGSHSVNGVAKLHSEILKINTLKPFYTWFPERFNNKTNGVTHRRWLIESNPQLTELICDSIGDGWIHAPEKLLALEPFGEDKVFHEQLAAVKQKRKELLAEYLHKERNVTINPNSIFDIQIKRMHMYKRQLLNILHVYHLYRQLLENPNRDVVPRTFIFGGKAAASYGEAKITIKLINTVAKLIEKDYRAARKLKVVFLENYNVSLGQKLFPAADVSEQISTASKEASGTGNMKFMFNGAITLGTMDGANVEIHQEVGDEHSVIFGLRAEEVQRYYQEGGYSSWDIYNSDADVRRVLEVMEENPMFGLLQEALLDRNDEFFVLKDFKPYCAAQQEIERRYRDTDGWFRSSTVNIAHAGHFSSDRSIQEYAKDIWYLTPVKI